MKKQDETLWKELADERGIALHAMSIRIELQNVRIMELEAALRDVSALVAVATLVLEQDK